MFNYFTNIKSDANIDIWSLIYKIFNFFIIQNIFENSKLEIVDDFFNNLLYKLVNTAIMFLYKISLYGNCIYIIENAILTTEKWKVDIFRVTWSTPYGESEFQFEILFIILLSQKLDSKILKIFYLITKNFNLTIFKLFGNFYF